MHNDNLLHIFMCYMLSILPRNLCINVEIKTSFSQLYLIDLKRSDLLVSREKRIRINLCHRNKHQTESLVGKYQYFPRIVRATNMHSIRLQMANRQ